MTYDVIVVGAGGIGSAAIAHLAGRGLRVLGIDRFRPPHTYGSTHGGNRLIRKAYFEDPRYIPLLERSYTLWRELEERSGTRLYFDTGLLVLSDGPHRAQAVAEEYGIALEVLSAAEVRQRYPAFSVGDGYHGLLEPDAGYLAVEAAVRAHLQTNAELRFDERVLSWESLGNHVRVQTDRGRYEAGALVLAPGAWSAELAPGLDMQLKVTRAPQFWFEGAAPGLPCFAFARGGEFIYGFPDLKICNYAPSTPLADPLAKDPAYTAAELEPVARAVREFLPGVRPEPVRWNICMFTLSPDENFILDRHPAHANVFLFAGDSGHAFKFAPVLGELLADMVAGAKGPAFLAYTPGGRR
ncbi:MAG: hypothetical protein JWM80_719 [Cyanobacteria bacterium RYN_339]|nr:hypothetical protein [Cyanobacteria bacterium RYN_339]